VEVHVRSTLHTSMFSLAQQRLLKRVQLEQKVDHGAYRLTAYHVSCVNKVSGGGLGQKHTGNRDRQR
jgi:hypothetical protein